MAANVRLFLHPVFSSSSTAQPQQHPATSSSLPLSLSLSRSPPATLLFLILILLALSSTLFSLIADCDEVFNYWEALHLLLFGGNDAPEGKSFKTWEYDPVYAIRSWTYLAVVGGVGGKLVRAVGASKLETFYAVRLLLGITHAFCSTRLVTRVGHTVSPRCAWFLFFFLAFNAGIWSASVALLPSSFTMYTTTLAFSFAIQPSRSASPMAPSNRTLPLNEKGRLSKAVSYFAIGALLGWPFALVLSFPFVFEELLLPSGTLIRKNQYFTFLLSRTKSFINAALVASAIAAPILIIDSIFYGRFVLVPLNIVVYNILSSRRGAGPELYGTEPWWFYLANLALNAGPVILLLSLGAAPILLLSRLLTPERFVKSVPTDVAQAVKEKSAMKAPSALVGSSSFSLLLVRLAPFYLWLVLLSMQPHKEERFMFPAYTLMAFNAALALELIVGVLEKVIAFISGSTSEISTQRPPTSTSTSFSSITPAKLLSNLASVAVITISCLFAVLRVLSNLHNYDGPVTVLSQLNLPGGADEIRDFFPAVGGSEDGSGTLKMCYGKEWYRFPSSFYLPEGFEAGWIKSGFDGILPGYFIENDNAPSSSSTSDPAFSAWNSFDSFLPASAQSLLRTTRSSQPHLYNDLNQEQPERYLDAATDCHLLIDSELTTKPSSPAAPSRDVDEPDYIDDSSNWLQLQCAQLYDPSATKAADADLTAPTEQPLNRIDKVLRTLSRTLYLPFLEPNHRSSTSSSSSSSSSSPGTKQYRNFCLVANRRLLRGEVREELERQEESNRLWDQGVGKYLSE